MIGQSNVHAKHNTIKVQDVFLLKKIDFLSCIVFYRFTSHLTLHVWRHSRLGSLGSLGRLGRLVLLV